jgi:hypothetical protein
MGPSRTYIKIPSPVSVEFARRSGTLSTLEGPVQYQQGDALVTGVSGERWPVTREQFMATYEVVPGQRIGDSSLYRKREMLVTAVQAETGMVVEMKLHSSTLFAAKGDWIVTSPDGIRWVVAADIFPRTYKLANELGEML